MRITSEIDQAGIYDTAPGNKYFGQWLMDDCAAYPLAAAEGEPVTPERPPYPQARDYEARLGMTPRRSHAALLKKVIFFEDVGQNDSKQRRFAALRERLQAPFPARPHPGVFLLRGDSGERRLLRNEREVAERLREKRGFRVIDPSRLDVAAVLEVCAGARIIAGVEGSQLLHGIMMLRRGGGVFTIQPPQRFVTVLKDMTDRDEQWFGYVVARQEGDAFWADPDEIERTLDLFPCPE
jgi:hypothetical protein